jgi:hypothetical protein
MKCANCTKDAFYIYQITEGKQILYCNNHLPKFLEQAKKAGLLKTTEALKSVLEEGFKKILSTPDEPVLETETTPTPTPSKKTTKKAATKNAHHS